MEDILIQLKNELSDSISPSTIIEYAPAPVSQASNIVQDELVLKLVDNMETVLQMLDMAKQNFKESKKAAFFYPIML
jgi:hypothetical protein